MKEVLNFQFYSVVKNEDAPTFIGNDFLVAADGLGGAGSALHEIDFEKHPDLKSEIFEAAYGDFDEEIKKDIEEYLNSLVLQIADGNAHTSALWASRIIIGRFVYAMIKKDIDEDGFDLFGEKTREKLSKFITKGLRNVAESLSLERGEFDNQLLLPSTLAAIRFEEKKDSVDVECIWAGDSRCYALLPSGLKLLSVDDEDASGAITNLFFVGDKKTVLNYRRYELKKPCAVMTVSDGVFDPFDPDDYLGVEYTFEEAILKAETVDGLSRALSEKYDEIHGDDTTVAFAAFGFDSFEQFKESLTERSTYVADVCRRMAELKMKTEIASIPEEEVYGYIRSRTSDKYASIAPILINAILNKEADIAAGEKLEEKVELLKKDMAEKAKKDHAEKKLEVFDKVYGVLSGSPEKVKEYFDWDAISTCERAAGYFANLLGVSESYLKSVATTLKQKDRYEQFEREREEIREEIAKKLDYYYRVIRKNSTLPRNEESGEKRTMLLKLQVFWNEVECAFENNVEIGNYKEFVYSNRLLSILKLDKMRLSRSDEMLMNRIRKFYDTKRGISDRSKDFASQEKMSLKKYESALCAALDSIRSEKEPERFFSESLKSLIGFKKSEPVGEAAIDPEKLRKAVEDMFAKEKEAIVELVVEALAAAYDKNSAIDIMYNGTKLRRFRVYNSYKGSSMQDVFDFREELGRMESEFNSLLQDVSE